MSQKIEFIYWFAYFNLESPSVRYRGKYPLEYLKSNYNIHSYFVIPGYRPSRIIIFLSAYISALFFRKNNSIIVIQRIHSGFIYSTLLKLLIRFRKSRTYYDLDDADYLAYPPNNIFHFLKNCEGVIVGSHELKKNLAKYNKKIKLNTSPVPDLQIYKSAKNSTLTIGWIGDFAGDHKAALIKYFFPSLYNLPFKIKLIIVGVGRKNKNDFQFLGNHFSDYKNVELELPDKIDWQNERNIQSLIKEFDLGIATLLDNELHRSKSAFKIKQYLNNGIPVLSTDLPENNFFIKDGENGFLCSTPEQFRERIIQFQEMSDEKYMKFSTRMRKSKDVFNLKAYCEMLANLA